MRARATTAELVAAILRPVRSTVAGVAAQIGVALEQDADGGGAPEGVRAAAPPIRSAAGDDAASSAAGDDAASSAAGDDAASSAAGDDDEAAHHGYVDPGRGLPPVARARLGSPDAPSRPPLRVGGSRTANRIPSPEELAVASMAANRAVDAASAPAGPEVASGYSRCVRDLRVDAASAPAGPEVDRAARIAAAPRAASPNARPVWMMRTMRSRQSAGASAPTDAEHAPSRAFPSAPLDAEHAPSRALHADIEAPVRGKRTFVPEPHAAPAERADSTVPPGEPLRLFFDRSVALEDAQRLPRRAQPATTGLPAAGPGALRASPPRAVAALAERIARGTAPIWDEAHRVTSDALANDRASIPLTAAPPSTHNEVPGRDERARWAMMAPQAPPDLGAPGAPETLPPAVSNTFNVHVQLDDGAPERGDAPLDRDALEQALCEILRDAARRNGLEV